MECLTATVPRFGRGFLPAAEGRNLSRNMSRKIQKMLLIAVMSGRRVSIQS